MFSGKAAREFFPRGARIFYFPNQNEKVPAPRFAEHRNRKLWRVNGLLDGCPFPFRFLSLD
ncbi:hypothetical protein HMPREF1990_00718 [Porphyromonas gingivalis W4087]|uniref:Uncharacterized protein n=1 Tax=Porphyromonas gingivalis F0570 TaxID=1227271 RepID=A0A0E2M878_PORGN|nr:hypothetical protein HMPREF1554_01566 [Porphyromonas gingivalis F0569]ERJ68886.1 hypothetical protein HMPREF1555_00167 [Porphyromonas gingivalis F0570]ERJ89998.1 hypothetical protein HMPREF1990_00718 [Porphyromonas gingivalis W4087]